MTRDHLTRLALASALVLAAGCNGATSPNGSSSKSTASTTAGSTTGHSTIGSTTSGTTTSGSTTGSTTGGSTGKTGSTGSPGKPLNPGTPAPSPSPGTSPTPAPAASPTPSPAPSPAASPSPSPTPVAATPTARWVYVANQSGASIDQLAVSSTAALSPVATVSLPSTSYLWQLVHDPGRGLLYALDGGSLQLYAFAIDPTTGALTQTAATPVLAANTTGYVPYSFGQLALVPGGAWLVVQDNAAECVKTYAPSATGAVTLASTWAAGAGNTVTGFSVDATGAFVYVTTGNGTAVQLALDPATGALTPVGTPPTAGILPTGVGLDPVAAFAYVLQPNQIQGWTRDATGALSATGHNVSMSAYTGSISVEPTGHHAYLVAMANNATNTGVVGQIRTYSIDPTSGALTYVTGAAYSPATVQGQLKGVSFDASGSFVYGVTSNPDSVATFTIDPATGLCWPLATTAVPTANAGPSSVCAVP